MWRKLQQERFEYPHHIYPPPIIYLEKNLRIAMRMVSCGRKSKLDFLNISVLFNGSSRRNISPLPGPSLLKDSDSICSNIPEKRQQLQVSLVELACSTEDVIEAYVFYHSLNSKTFNFISTKTKLYNGRSSFF